MRGKKIPSISKAKPKVHKFFDEEREAGSEKNEEEADKVDAEGSGEVSQENRKRIATEEEGGSESKRVRLDEQDQSKQ